MSSAGSISAMVTSLKNNKRDRKSALKKLKKLGNIFNDEIKRFLFKKLLQLEFSLFY